MPKIYALLNVKTLLNKDKMHEKNIIEALQKYNIKDVWLYTDMSFSPLEVTETKQLINYLENNQFTVYGVLATADLFWAAPHTELDQLKEKMIKHGISNDSAHISSNQIMGLLNDGLTCIASVIGGMKVCASTPGATFLDVDTTNIFKRADSAKDALNIYRINGEILLPPKGLLLQYFFMNKPADFNGCVIFETDNIVLDSVERFAKQKNIPVVTVELEEQNCSDNMSCREQYIRRIQSDFANQILLPEGIYSVDNDRSMNDTWLTDEISQRIQDSYKKDRGFKFFGFSSHNSLKVFSDINRVTFRVSKTREANQYLAAPENKGKRLYNILLEQKIQFVRPQINSSGPNINWLTEDVLYLINQKYKKQRGFILFGYSCEKSIDLLNQLNSDKTLQEKQQAIEEYLNDDTCHGKRLFKIITDLKNLVTQPIQQRFSLQS